MFDGEIVAFLTIVGGGLLTVAFYIVIATRSGTWILNTDAFIAIVGNCVTLVPATYFLAGLIVEVGAHIIFKGTPPVIPLGGNEAALAIVFAYAILLSLGSNYRLYRASSKTRR